MSSSVRDITESTEAEGRDDTHHTCRVGSPGSTRKTSTIEALDTPVPEHFLFSNLEL